jgi:hypothetical protein
MRPDRLAGRAADRQSLERAGHDLVDPGQGLLSGKLARRVVLGDLTPHRAAQEHDDAVVHWCHYPERGDIVWHAADNPGGQAGCDHAGQRSGVRGDSGGKVEEFPGDLVSVAFGRCVARDQDDGVTEPTDEAAAWLDAYVCGHLFHGASPFVIDKRTRTFLRMVRSALLWW